MKWLRRGQSSPDPVQFCGRSHECRRCKRAPSYNWQCRVCETLCVQGSSSNQYRPAWRTCGGRPCSDPCACGFAFPGLDLGTLVEHNGGSPTKARLLQTSIRSWGKLNCVYVSCNKFKLRPSASLTLRVILDYRPVLSRLTGQIMLLRLLNVRSR